MVFICTEEKLTVECSFLLVLHCAYQADNPCWVVSALDIFTKTMHQDLHHQKVKGNYRLYFIWWDPIMGTEFPGYKEEFRRFVQKTDNKASTYLKTTS
jgi:sterol desaturase/sphingolipid hydroxylase (fatty acid hydroxylase superfamily)